MLKQYTILLLFCLCAAHSAATSLSLRDCMEYAIAHSAKMEIHRANNDDARIARREAILRAFTPTIQGSTYASLNFGRGIDPETNNYISTTSFNNGYSVSDRKSTRLNSSHTL